jgi:hypothetical protein
VVDVSFEQLRDWALVPDAPRADRRGSRAERDLYAQHFRYMRIARLPVDCPPWVLGQELGWLVRSPVTVNLGPVVDVEFAVPATEEVADVARKLHVGELWRRDGAWVATPDAAWMRMFDFRTENGWQGMFVPNGSGTVEWHLGWAATIPDRYFLLVVGAGCPALEVPVGVVAAHALNAMRERGGFSLAVRPTARATIHRGEPVARVVVLHPDSLQARSREGADHDGH